MASPPTPLPTGFHMASPPLAHREPGALGLSAGLGAAAVGMVAAWLSLPLALGLAGGLGLGLGLWAKRRAATG